jgi:hypothetical protein
MKKPQRVEKNIARDNLSKASVNLRKTFGK